MPPPRAERGPLDLDRHPTHTRNPHLSGLLSPLPPSTSHRTRHQGRGQGLQAEEQHRGRPRRPRPQPLALPRVGGCCPRPGIVQGGVCFAYSYIKNIILEQTSVRGAAAGCSRLAVLAQGAGRGETPARGGCRRGGPQAGTHEHAGWLASPNEAAIGPSLCAATAPAEARSHAPPPRPADGGSLHLRQVSESQPAAGAPDRATRRPRREARAGEDCRRAVGASAPRHRVYAITASARVHRDPNRVAGEGAELAERATLSQADRGEHIRAYRGRLDFSAPWFSAVKVRTNRASSLNSEDHHATQGLQGWGARRRPYTQA